MKRTSGGRWALTWRAMVDDSYRLVYDSERSRVWLCRPFQGIVSVARRERQRG
jgi:hypothetical protein